MAHVRIDEDLIPKVKKIQKETYSKSFSHAVNLLVRHGHANWKPKQGIPCKLHNGHD